MTRFERPSRDYCLILFSAVLWGSVGVFVRWAGMPGREMALVFWRLLIGGGFYLIAILVTRRFDVLRLGKHPRLLLASGVILTIHWVCFFKAINLLSLSDAEFITYLAPVLVALTAPFVLKEKLERNTVIALVPALAGVSLLSLTGSSGKPFSGLGLFYASITAVSYTGLVFALKRLREDTPAMTVTFYQTLVGVVLIAPFMPFQHYTVTAKGWGSIAVLGIVLVGLNGLLYIYAARGVKAQHLGIISYVEPLSALFYGWLLLSEKPGWEDLAGGLLIVLAGLIIFLRPSRESPGTQGS